MAVNKFGTSAFARPLFKMPRSPSACQNPSNKKNYPNRFLKRSVDMKTCGTITFCAEPYSHFCHGLKLQLVMTHFGNKIRYICLLGSQKGKSIYFPTNFNGLIFTNLKRKTEITRRFVMRSVYNLFLL